MIFISYNKNSKFYFKFIIDSLPKKCECFRNFTGIKENKTIDRFFKGKRLCILKDNKTSTLDYLKSSMDSCPDKYRCQNYFCAEKLSSKKCPLVDVFISRLTEQAPTNNTNFIANSTDQYTQYSFNSSTINIIPTTQYTRTIVDKLTFENTVYLPMLNLRIERSGKCNIKNDSSLSIDYSVISNVECPLDQQISPFYNEDIKAVLNANDNYFDYLNEKLPLFGYILNQDIKWSMGVEYAFQRNTLGCLLTNYAKINKNDFFSPQSNTTEFEKKLENMQNLLQVFVNFKQKYAFQEKTQQAILIINSVVVFFNLILIFFKLFKLCVKCPSICESISDYESIISFLMDITIAILGGISFFTIQRFTNLIDNLLSSECIDNLIQYQFGIFNDALQSTGDQNLQIFIFILFKIIIIFLSIVFYMCYKKCSFRFKSLNRIIFENINEGENEIELSILEKIDHKKNNIVLGKLNKEIDEKKDENPKTDNIYGETNNINVKNSENLKK